MGHYEVSPGSGARIEKSPGILAILGLGFALQSVLGVVALWAIMWAPFYLARSRFGQYMFYIALLIPWLVCMATALAGLVLSLCALGQRHASSRGVGWVVTGTAVSSAVLFASLPALFSGDLPLELLGIE